MLDAVQYATPDKIFPAITLLLLAYVNRFSALSAKTREFKDKKGLSSSQTAALHKRVHLVKHMLVLGMAGVAVALVDFMAIALGAHHALSMLLMLAAAALVAASLVTAIREVAMSTEALDEEIEEKAEDREDLPKGCCSLDKDLGNSQRGTRTALDTGCLCASRAPTDIEEAVAQRDH